MQKPLKLLIKRFSLGFGGSAMAWAVAR
jgi:hypothetical protein